MKSNKDLGSKQRHAAEIINKNIIYNTYEFQFLALFYFLILVMYCEMFFEFVRKNREEEFLISGGIEFQTLIL